MPEISDSDFRQFVAYQNLGSIGEIQKKIGDLEKDNGKHREEIRELKEKVPKETDAVVPKEKAEALAAYEALGKPEELKATLEKVPTLEQQLASREKRDRLGKAARLLSADEGAAEHLQKYLPDLADRLEFREVKEGETKAERAFYKPESGDAQALAEYLEAEHPLVWKGLQKDGTQPQRRSVPFGPQSGDGVPAKPESLIAKQIEANQKAARAPNPLRPAAT